MTVGQLAATGWDIKMNSPSSSTMNKSLVLLGAMALLVVSVMWLFRAGDAPPSPTKVEGPQTQTESQAAKNDQARDDPSLIDTKPFRDADAAPSTHIRGIVVDAEGEPIPEARVTASVIALGEAEMAPPAMTDPSGIFRIVVTPGWLSMTVAATAAGYTPALLREIPAGSNDLRIVMRPGVRLSGQVSDESGRPIGNATVSWDSSAPESVVQRVQVDDSGLYVFEDVARNVVVRCEAPGFGARTMHANRLVRDSTLDIVLLRTTSVSGRIVRGADISPCPDAKVELWVCEGYFGQGTVPKVTRLSSTTTGPDGRFELAEVPAVTEDYLLFGGMTAHLALWIRAEGSAPAWVRLPFTDTPSRDLGDIMVHAAGTITGRVIDAQGKGFAGARVLYTHDTASYVRSLAEKASIDPFRFAMLSGSPPLDCTVAVTDEKGSYAVDVPVGTTPSPGAVQALPRLSNPVRVKVTARAGETTMAPDLVVSVLVGAKFHARVVDRDTGEPLAGARVSDWGPDVFTDREGRFALPLFPGSPVPEAPVMVVRSGYVTAQVKVDQTRTDASAPMTIALAPSFSLAGRVVDAYGSPTAGALVKIFDGAVDPAIALRHRSALSVDGVYAVMSTDAIGEFSCSGLLRGPYHIVASHPAYSDEAIFGIRESVATGTNDVIVRLEDDVTESRIGVIQIVGESMGTPLDLLEPPRVELRGRTERGVRIGPGRYRFDNLALDRVSVLIPGANRRQRTFQNVELGERAFEIILPDRPSVAAVSYPPGASFATLIFDVAIASSGEVVAQGHAKEGGFEISDLATGSYSISLSPESTRQFRVEGSGHRLVDVPGGRVEIRLLPRH